MTWDIPQVLQLAGTVIIGLLVVLYKYHEDRLKTLETTRQNKADADQQRAELREELQDFRDDVSQRFESLTTESSAKRVEAHEELISFKNEISHKVETMRVETNTKLDKLFDQIAALASTYAKASRTSRK